MIIQEHHEILLQSLHHLLKTLLLQSNLKNHVRMNKFKLILQNHVLMNEFKLILQNHVLMNEFKLILQNHIPMNKLILILQKGSGNNVKPIKKTFPTKGEEKQNQINKLA
jgi:hypothetical protein